MELRLRSVLAIVLLAALVAGCSRDTADLENSGSSGTPAPQAVAVEQVLTDTKAAGDVRLLIDVEAEMPPDFDDGQPERSFEGRGFMDWDSDLAGVTYQMSDVPNAAGYFGDVGKKMSVFYLKGGFLASFPLLVRALGGQGDWFHYELRDFVSPKIRRLGIGQLREIGLSDPRLGLALLQGLPDELSGGFYSPVEETSASNYALTSDVAAAAAEADDFLGPQFDALLDLGLNQVKMELALDPLERVRRLTYELTYPPADGSPPARLFVTLNLLKFGLEGGLTPPPEERVLDYSDYLAR